MFRTLCLPALALLGACDASQTGGMSDEEFDRRLREALLRNPEIILEAIETYRADLEAEAETAARESVAGLLPELVAAESGHAVGAPADEAELVIVEFFDYNCGFCRQAMSDVMERIDANPGLRVVFQELPILSESSRDAALASVAAGRLEESGYLAAHRALFDSEGRLDEKAIDNALKRAGLDPEEVERTLDRDAEEIEAQIERSLDLAGQIGVRGSPFFIVLNPDTGTFEMMEGYRTDQFAELVSRVAG